MEELQELLGELKVQMPAMAAGNGPSVSDFEQTLNDAIRASIVSDRDPMRTLSLMHDRLLSASASNGPAGQEMRKMVISYMALYVLFPVDMFGGKDGEAPGDPLIRALIKGYLGQEALEQLLEWSDGESSHAAVETALTALGQGLGASNITSKGLPSLVIAATRIYSACWQWLRQKPDFGHGDVLQSLTEVKFGEDLTSGLMSIDSIDMTSDSRGKGPSKAELESATGVLRAAASLLVGYLQDLFLQLARKDKGRIGVQWLLVHCNRNKGRLKMQFDADAVCSDSAALLIARALLRLTLPFAAPASRPDKVKLIDRQYYDRYQARLDITSSNRIIESILAPADSAGEEPNFVTDCFYLTVHYLKMSYQRAIELYHETLQDIAQVERSVDTMDLDRLPPHARLAVNKQWRGLLASRHHAETVLLDDELHAELEPFMSLMMDHLLSLLGSADYGRLPEFYLDTVIDHFIFLSRYQPERWLRHPEVDLFLTFAVSLLSDPQTTRNVHTRAQLVEIMCGWTVAGHVPGSYPLAHLFLLSLRGGRPLSLALTPLLLQLYVEVESTGSSGQFYEKFSIRYNITRILEVLWAYSGEYRQCILGQARRPESFLRFQNMLINDCTYLLDESLSKLSELNRLQAEAGPVGNAEGQERQRQVFTLERQLQGMMQLGNATLDALVYLTAGVQQPFTRPEIVHRLAAMLLVNLRQLVGPRCSQLKVKNKEKYHFDPKRLLSNIVRVFLNLGEEREFLVAVRSDSRSFEPLVFAEAVQVLERTRCIGQDDIQRFRALAQRLEQMEADADVEPEDIPEEFSDPLMFTLMRDPVRLRTSGVTVDRGTIRAHLLNDPHDPFNRMPLAEDDLVSDPELRGKIHKWLLQQGPGRHENEK